MERNILADVDHPFIVKLHYAFQTEGKLYLILEFLRATSAAEQGVPYSMTVRKTYSFCGTVEYMAPEVLIGKGHGTARRYGGATECSCSRCSPARCRFQGSTRKETMHQILKAQAGYAAVSVRRCLKVSLRALFKRKSGQPLGSGPNGIAELKSALILCQHRLGRPASRGASSRHSNQFALGLTTRSTLTMSTPNRTPQDSPCMPPSATANELFRASPTWPAAADCNSSRTSSRALIIDCAKRDPRRRGRNFACASPSTPTSVCDFGFAKQLRADNGLLMTPCYTASFGYSAACDVWSAGVLLYTMLADRLRTRTARPTRPRRYSTELRLAAWNLRRQLGVRVTRCQGGLTDLVRRMLHVDPSQRITLRPRYCSTPGCASFRSADVSPRCAPRGRQMLGAMRATFAALNSTSTGAGNSGRGGAGRQAAQVPALQSVASV
uniref:Protein kinase domain-containing protein n=1 Tax=Macrostomum lignano TaxID=282301 RepID=A0A1I8FK90_9PLAT